jgi:TonB dependent receptor/TonB-dependent Receptor Plug Domain
LFRPLRLLLIAVLLPQAVLAQPDTAVELRVSTPADLDDTIFVWGQRELGVGSGTSASEGSVSFGAFADRPLLRTGEIAEVIPGLAVTQHSGSGKANQYFLRGFNLDHGTDFSVSLNGAPLNLRTNAHGQGYLDLNVLLPELVDHIHYRKGPYFAEVGDFSAAGSADFKLFDNLAENFLTVTGGEHGYGRVVGATSVTAASYLALDASVSDGPWSNSERLRRGNFLYNYNAGDWALTALAYQSQWNSTDQIPLRAVQAGTLSALGNLDPTDGGQTSRVLFTAQRRANDGLEASLYLQRYALKLWSNFTYFLDDPVNGDQFQQAENRWIGGGQLAYKLGLSDDWSLTSGAQARYDYIGNIGLYRTKARVRLRTDREDRVEQGSAALYSTLQWSHDAWRASLGGRVEGMNVDVASSNSLNSGRKSGTLFSPKATLAYRAAQDLELYVDAGRGFHSNDARGAVARVAPVSGEAIDPVNLYVPATGGEVGVRYEHEGFSASLALWTLKLDSELVYSGDAGDTESSNASQRKGIEALLNWTPIKGVNIDVSAATTQARYLDTLPGQDRIPNALRYVLTAGVAVAASPRTSAELTVRRLGPAPLTEDGSVNSGTSTLTNLLYRYNFDHVSVFAEVLNVFNRHDNDITYFYTSRLKGEPADGIDDVHFHPMEPRTVRLGLRYTP